MPHEQVFSFGIVEAKESQVLEDGKEKPPMNLGYFFVVHDVNIVDERLVNSLSHV